MAEEYTDHIAPHAVSADWAVPPVDDILPRTLGDLWAMPPEQQALALEILEHREDDEQHDCSQAVGSHDDCVPGDQVRTAYLSLEGARDALTDVMRALET